MDMSMSGGMEMGSDPLFRTLNQRLARIYWYIIAGLLGFLLLLRAFEYYQIRSRSVTMPMSFRAVLEIL